MTPERMWFILEHCRERRGVARVVAHREFIEFFAVRPITLRRWLKGERPIPRAVELLLEIKHAWPEINATALQRKMNSSKRNEGT